MVGEVHAKQFIEGINQAKGSVNEEVGAQNFEHKISFDDAVVGVVVKVRELCIFGWEVDSVDICFGLIYFPLNVLWDLDVLFSGYNWGSSS